VRLLFKRLISQARLSWQRAKRQDGDLESGEIRSHARAQLRRMASTITMHAVFDQRHPRSGG